MIHLAHFCLSYQNKQLLENANFKASSHELIFIKGPSGCGKTTLLYAISLISKLDGSYYWNQQDISSFNDQKRANIRKTKMGIVMQNSMLYSHKSVKGNISYYASLNNIQLSEQDIIQYLQKLHMEESLNKKVKHLSGGEQQRIAMICAVVKKPQVLILDEPTSQLDKKTEQLVMDWIIEMKEKEKICIIMTTHKDLDHYADKVYLFENKQLKLIFHKDTKLQKETNELSLTINQKKEIRAFQYNYISFIKHFVLFCVIPLLAILLSYMISYYHQHQIQILEEDSIKMIYSQDYQPQTIDIEGREVTLLFYVPQNHLENRATVTYSQNGCYINQELFQDLHRDLKGKTLSINYHQQTMDIQVSGILTNDTIINDQTNQFYLYLPLEEYKQITNINPVKQINSLENLSYYSSQQIIFIDDLKSLENYHNLNTFYKYLDQLLYGIYMISVIIFVFIWTYTNKKRYIQRYIDGFSKYNLFIEFLCTNIIDLLIQILLMNLLFNEVNTLKYLGIFYILLILINGIGILRLTLRNTLRY